VHFETDQSKSKVNIKKVNNFSGTTDFCDRPESVLINLKSRGSLTYPNKILFSLVTD